jgi:hypothetical protein
MHCILEDSVDVAELAVELRRCWKRELEVCSARTVGCVTLMRMKTDSEGARGWSARTRLSTANDGDDGKFAVWSSGESCVRCAVWVRCAGTGVYGNYCLLTLSFGALLRFLCN